MPTTYWTIRFFLFVGLLGLNFCIEAQNLVPNSGFEEKTNGRVAIWKQPSGEFYHHEGGYIDTNGVLIYNHVNGICIISPEPSEFMFAPLKKSLVAGQVYCLKLKLNLREFMHGRPEMVKQVELAFLNEAYESENRQIIKVRPDIIIPVDTLSDRPIWQYIDLEFTATKAAKYVYIGRFFNDDIINTYKTSKHITDSITIVTKQKVSAMQDSIAGYVLPIPEVKTKREIKKQITLLHQFTRMQKNRKDSITIAQLQQLKQQVDSVNNQYLRNIYYHERIYFDDICIAPKSISGLCNCTDSVVQEVYATGKTFTLKRVYFDTDKSVIKPESEVELTNLLQILTDQPKMHIQINGHTDSINSPAYNLKLSAARAKAVANWLIQKGIAANRLTTKGYGDSLPIAPNNTIAGRELNRRVEFVVIKN